MSYHPVFDVEGLPGVQLAVLQEGQVMARCREWWWWPSSGITGPPACSPPGGGYLMSLPGTSGSWHFLCNTYFINQD